jgi:energy-coupling factor transporter transmembrane protein EcfT
MVHPTLRILGLFILAVAIQFMAVRPLLILGFCLSLVVLAFWRTWLLRTLKRSRWLLAAMIVVYAYSTPGEYVRAWPMEFAPTYEGLQAGGLQAIRLLMMLAGLAVLIGSTRRELLLAGIYILLKPLSYLGMPVDRFAARLWLTMEYVERPELHASPAARLHALIYGVDREENPQVIQLDAPRWTWVDGAVMVGLSVGVGWWLG